MQEQHETSGESTGAFAFGLNRSREQLAFLRSIEKEVPEALGALKDSVLPLFANKPLARQVSSKEGILDLLLWVPPNVVFDENVWQYPPPPSPELLKIPGYDSETWCAIWDWAEGFGLVEAGDVSRLKTPQAVAIARHMDANLLFRSFPIFVEPFSTDSSSITFALPVLIRVVLCTLRAWADGRASGKWVFPKKERTYFDKLATEKQWNMPFHDMKELIDSGLMRRPDPPPYVYYFWTRAWNVQRETRSQAQQRISNDLTNQLRQWMDIHEAFAERTGNKELPRKFQSAHFNWLALYQVKGLGYPEITELAKKTWGRKNITLEDLKKTIHSGIRKTAELVIGSSWKSWLRVSKPGRPKKPS